MYHTLVRPILLLATGYTKASISRGRKTNIRMVTTRKRRSCEADDARSAGASSSHKKIAPISPSTAAAAASSSTLSPSGSSVRLSSSADLSRLWVEELLRDAGITSTRTKSGWCLKEGLTHLVSADRGKLMPLVQQHGPPAIYAAPQERRRGDQKTCRHDDDDARRCDENLDKLKHQPQNCYQALCRIVAGQQLAGAAAKTVWNRLLTTTQHKLSPQVVLELADRGLEEYLQKPAGLSGSKARSIVALAEAFSPMDSTEEDKRGANTGRLSDDFLTTADDDDVRDALLAIKGIGPWSCDMFMMFYLERSNVLPLGDLGVRKGIAKHFALRGKGKGGSLCPKNDAELIQKAFQPYRPYQSLASYYMWRVADTKDAY